MSPLWLYLLFGAIALLVTLGPTVALLRWERGQRAPRERFIAQVLTDLARLPAVDPTPVHTSP